MASSSSELPIDAGRNRKGTLVQYRAQQSDLRKFDHLLGLTGRFAPRSVRLQNQDHPVRQFPERTSVRKGIDGWGIDENVVELGSQLRNSRLQALGSQQSMNIAGVQASGHHPQLAAVHLLRKISHGPGLRNSIH